MSLHGNASSSCILCNYIYPLLLSVLFFQNSINMCFNMYGHGFKSSILIVIKSRFFSVLAIQVAMSKTDLEA